MINVILVDCEPERDNYGIADVAALFNKKYSKYEILQIGTSTF